MNKAALRVLHVVAHLHEPHGLAILDEINRDITPNWLTLWFPSLQALQGMSIGGMHVHLMRLEDAGLLWSKWGDERLPERNYHRRRLCYLTSAGCAALKGDQP